MLQAILKKELSVNKAVSRTAGVVIFILLTALGGFIRIPLGFTPVPLTLQTLFVLLSGGLLGSWLGLASQSGYLLLGILGAPVFSEAGKGILYFSGPTAGYLFGFTAASFFAGRLLKHTDKTYLSVFFTLLAIDLVCILGCGTAWFKLISGCPWHTALLMGFLPFVSVDAVKVALASSAYIRFKRISAELF